MIKCYHHRPCHTHHLWPTKNNKLYLITVCSTFLARKQLYCKCCVLHVLWLAYNNRYNIADIDQIVFFRSLLLTLTFCKSKSEQQILGSLHYFWHFHFHPPLKEPISFSNSIQIYWNFISAFQQVMKKSKVLNVLYFISSSKVVWGKEMVFNY